MTGEGLPHVDTGAVGEYVTRARWFGGKGRDATVTAVRRLGRIGRGTEPAVVVDVAEVGYADGEPELYQLPLALYAEHQGRLEHAHVGTWTEPELGEVHAYDAVHDREAMAAWLVDATMNSASNPLPELRRK